MKILMIEDDANIIDAVSIFLTMRLPGVKMISTHLGRRGIELVRTEAPDVILLDLGLPDIDGFQVLERIRSFSSAPVIILTVISGKENVEKGLRMGAEYYIVKPFKQGELLARLNDVLAPRAPETTSQGLSKNGNPKKES